MNEKEVKSGEKYPTCSVTGRRCECGSTGRCVARLGNGRLDTPTAETIRWTKVAVLRCQDAADAIETALRHCERARPYPGPELREFHRLVVAAMRLGKELGE